MLKQNSLKYKSRVILKAIKTAKVVSARPEFIECS